MAIHSTGHAADPNTRQRLDEILREGEEMKMVVVNRDPTVKLLDSLGIDFLVRLARKFDGKYRILVTDERIVEFRVGNLRSAEEIPISSITSVRYIHGKPSKVKVSGPRYTKSLEIRKPEEGEILANRISKMVSEG